MKLEFHLGLLPGLLILLHTVTGVSLPGKIVRTRCGAVEGTMELSRERRLFFAWLAIPYAKAPVGRLRFEPPEPFGNWSGVMEAKHYPPRCAQFDAIQDLLMGQEDCLYLNVFLPKQLFLRAEAGESRFPVMVFIHGGGFLSGSSRDFRPEYFMDHDVLLVTLNYRLASFGFLNTDDGQIRGNMGLKDQSLALRWIQDNIQFFGGNSQQVTIFGESAGASSAQYHMLSPMSKGLFQRAISQSGVAASPFAFNERPGKQARLFAQQLSCPVEPPEEMVSCMRSKSTFDILQVHAKAKIWYQPESRRKENLFVPTVERFGNERFLSEHPHELLKKGKFERVPWMNGVNSAEGLIWMYPFVRNKAFREQLDEHWNKIAIQELFLGDPVELAKVGSIRDFYFGNLTLTDTSPTFGRYLELISDRMFYIEFLRAINWHVGEGRQGKGKGGQVWAYVYDKVGPSFAEVFFNLKESLPRLLGIVISRAKDFLRSEILRIPRHRDGACHGDEFIMLSPYLPLYYIGTKHPDFQFSRDLIQLWVSFATDNGSMELSFRGTKFPQYVPQENSDLFQIGEQTGLVKLSNIKDRLRFWDSLTSTLLTTTTEMSATEGDSSDDNSDYDDSGLIEF